MASLERSRRPRKNRVGAQVAAAILLCVVFVLAGCSGPEAASNANYVTFPEQTDGIELTSAAEQESGELVEPTADFVEIETTIADYLAVRANVVTGRAGAGAFLGVAQGQAVEAAIAEHETNEVAVANEYYSAVKSLWLWPNIVEIAREGEALVVIGCDERQEVNSINQHNLWFVENRYTLERVGQSLFVTSIEEMHNGFLEPGDRYGCAPQSFQERAEAAAATMWTELITVSRDPQSLQAGGLSDVFGAELGASIEDAAAEADGSSAPLSSGEDIVFTTVGVDTQADLLPVGRTEPGTTVVIESCRRFNEGLWFDDPETGESLEQMRPGSTLVQHLYVRLDSRPAGERNRDKVVLIETLPEATCTEVAR